ncbi:MAG TPA: DUF5808 domain-containing protein [Terracidiphilus sp.]|jgi:hypothetical protein
MTTSISLIGVVGSVAGLTAVAAFNSWTSRINQFFFFSRTVDAEFTAAAGARAITRRYLRGIQLGFGAALVLFSAMVLLTPASIYSSFMTALLAQCVCACAAFGKAHREAGEELAARGPMQAGSPGQGTAVAVSLLNPGAFTGPRMLMLALALVATALAWIVPMAMTGMRFNAFGDALSANHADFLSGLGLGMIAGSVLLFVQLRYFSRHRSPMARFTARGCVLLAWLAAVSTALSTFSVPFHYVITKELRMALLGVVLAVAVGRMVYGWTRAKLFPPPAVERNGDQFWRWGLFYYNPSDPTLFIQHRSGPGYTVNFANRMAWPLAALVLADFVFLMFIHLHR